MQDVVFNIKTKEREIFELMQLTAEEVGYPVYLVGGYVRDRLLARKSMDMDVVCLGSGIEFAKALSYRLKPIPQVCFYSRFGTAMIRHMNMEIEFVGARKESYSFDSRKPFVEEGSLEDDQDRRDFTINALAVSLNKENFGELIDPFDGLRDLEHKIIRTPLEPGKTFSDDPLRMMRAIRFSSQLDFEIEDITLQGIIKYKNRLNIVSKERITAELNKIIRSPRPSKGFKLLEETGLLKLILPEIVALKGVDIRNGIGHKDNFYHTLEVVDNISRYTTNLWLRWAALLHDVAKPPTKRFDDKAGWTFHGHEALGAIMVPKIFRRLRLPLDDKMKYVQKLVRLHLRPISLTKDNITDSAVRRLLFEAGNDIDDLMTLCRADITSKNKNKVERYLENYKFVQQRLEEVEALDSLRNWEPPISGDMIMSTFQLAPSPLVGEIKTAIREAILDGQLANNFDDAKSFMIEYVAKNNLLGEA